MTDNLTPSIEASNRAADTAFVRLTKKVARLSREMEEIAEQDMGLLMQAQASKFHKATQELRELDYWLQQQLALR